MLADIGGGEAYAADLFMLSAERLRAGEGVEGNWESCAASSVSAIVSRKSRVGEVCLQLRTT